MAAINDVLFNSGPSANLELGYFETVDSGVPATFTIRIRDAIIDTLCILFLFTKRTNSTLA